MTQLTLFIIITIFLAFSSRQALKNPGTHGFYRFFAFEGILSIILLNHPYWFNDPYHSMQLLSWLLLLSSAVFIIHAVIMIKQHGGHADRQETPENYYFENTTTIVKKGLYHHIRHPMYGSLLLLGWGAFFKHVTPLSTALILIVSGLLIITAKTEERENLSFFGKSYEGYIKQTKMFLPWIF